jgi:hypothetical protein
MRIGIDFDNTLVCYDRLFHRAAVEAGLIPAEVAQSKNSVRDHLRREGREPAWTQLQGVVYGARMAEAEAYPGAIGFLRQARARGCELFIVSHKTRRPIIGPAYDLHAAARAWLEANVGEALVPPHRTYFELTKEQKLARIAACGCMIFIDDLPEILLAAGFPGHIGRWLFDPSNSFPAVSGVKRFRMWRDLPAVLGLDAPAAA